MMKTLYNTARLVAALLMAMTAMSGYAQDSYREALKEFLSAKGASGTMKSLLLHMNDAMFKLTDDVNTAELTERFFKERFEDEFVKMMEPSMRARDLTEDDLREVTRLLSTPEGKIYASHEMDWLQKMPGTLISAMIKNISFDTDKEQWADAKIEINPDINADYAAKFHQIRERIMPENQLQSTLKEAMREDTTERSARLLKWLSNNIEAILLNSAYGHLTMEDLDYGIGLCTHDSFLKTNGLNFNQPSSLEEMKDLFTEYEEWMTANGAQPNDDEEITLGMIKTMSDFLGFEMPNFDPRGYDDEYDAYGFDDLDEWEGYFDDEITERDQLTATIVIKSSQDLIDLYNIEITYKGEDGINVTDTITTPRWTKTMVNKQFPTQIGIEGSRFLLKPGVETDKETYDLVCGFTIGAQQFGYNFQIVDERNVPADKVQSIFDNYDLISYQEMKMKSWGVDDVSFRGTFTVEQLDDAQHPFNFTQDK